jgi:hypothetical protein
MYKLLLQSVNRLAPEIERPQPVPGKNTMEILKHIVKKKVKAVSDRVSNFGQQLTGRRKKGTFAALEDAPITSRQQFPSTPPSQLHEPIESILTPEDLQMRYLKQEQKQLQRKHLENIKDGFTNPDVSELRDLTESGSHWESNPYSRSKKVMRAKENIGRAEQIAQNELQANESLTKIQSAIRNINAKAKLNRKAEKKKKLID